MPAEDTKRILVVDDDKVIHKWFETFFGNTYQITYVMTVKEACDILRSEQFDAMILDYMLPDGVGTDVLKTIQKDDALEQARETNVVMLTATRDSNVYEEAWELGTIQYVVKPMTHDTMADAIEQAVSQ